MANERPFAHSTHPSAPASGYVSPALSLTVVYPPELARQSFVLGPDLVLGRDPDRGVSCLEHPTISRRHAAVQIAMGGLLCLSDLGSRNGSRVDGKRSELPIPLVAQTVVRLGDVLLIADEASERPFDSDPVLPGSSARMVRLRQELERAATGTAPVLVIGETGTGKERLAQEVHRLSGREGPCLSLNCAELSPQLVESELFGHERGAFTGAASSKAGLFAAAQGGTLFLDEIGELPIDLQPKFLRVLEEGEVRPVGSATPKRVDVRVVAATNRNLADSVDAQTFRRDLYARLAFFELRLPPLRERRQDILHWISALLSAWNADNRSSADLAFLPDAAERILLHAWPDNLRGLDRLVHRLASLGLDRPIGLRTLSDAMPELAEADGAVQPAAGAGRTPTPDPEPGATEPPGEAVSDAPPGGSAARRPTREEFVAVYEACGRSVRATSKALGRDRRQIYRWLETYGIPREPEGD